MRPTALAVTLANPLFTLFGATASTSPSSRSDSEYSSKSPSKSSNGYDACVCGQQGYRKGSVFSFSPDAWNAEGSGFQCLSVVNGGSSTSAAFDATWNWPVSPDTVHSFPHVTFSSRHLPVSLDDISALRLTAVWAMAAGNDPSKNTGMDTNIASAEAKCNVAFDLFLDHDPDNASSAIDAAYEIMVWIGHIGQPYPLGYSLENASCYTQQLGSFNFTLYSGQNFRGTNVYTWVSPSNNTDFDEDISPLLQYLWRNELVSADARLGLVEFGSETYHSGGNVTFSASDFSMEILKGDPPAVELNPFGEDCVKPTIPAGPQSTDHPKDGLGARTAGGLHGLNMIMAIAISMMMTGDYGVNFPTLLVAIGVWRFSTY